MSEIHSEGNIYTAAYILASTGQLPTVTLEPNGRARFDFSDPDGNVGWLAQAWHLDKGVDDEVLTIPVKRFCPAIHQIKGAMGNARKQEGIYEGTTKTTNGARRSQSRNAIRQTNNHRV